jgi:hypothetical protein
MGLALTLLLAGCAEGFITDGEGPVDGGDSLELLRSACLEGDWPACDDLWNAAPAGSEDERIAATCGNRVALTGDGQPFGDCISRFTESSTRPTGPTNDEVRPPPMNSWIVVIASYSEDAPEAAFTHAAELRQTGIDGAVFRSDEFASLNPGFWVVYAGIFDDADAAAAYCEELRPVAPDCYRRFVGEEQ